MAPLHKDQCGYTLLELLLAAAAGVMVLAGLSLLYVATVRALDQSSSQAALQRVGALAIETVTRQAAHADSNAVRADTNPGTAPDPACLPGTTPGLLLRVMDRTTTPPTPWTYCYYAGAGDSNGPAGALCQRRVDSAGTITPASSCWDLLAAPQPGPFHVPGTRRIAIIKQDTANPGITAFCPRNTTDGAGASIDGGQAIANNGYCLAVNLVNGSPQTGDLAFGITDGINTMTFSGSLMLQNN
jgi:type II secretory pathway pseudopilin PulG